MLSAQLITIGTEITAGEVVNTNAAWISRRLESLGVRVYSHLSVRDQREEIDRALRFDAQPLTIVTGGLGPTSDDITRDCMAVFTGQPLDFDNQVWSDLTALYKARQLPLREAHRWQCHFPRGAVKMNNTTGTALGFYQQINDRHFFVLPGPPRELEGMWLAEVEPRLKTFLKGPANLVWHRWTCLGAPESEVAEKLEPVVKETGLEVGYRAQVPYVRVKIYADPVQHQAVIQAIEQALAPWIVARGDEDLAGNLLALWPDQEFTLIDQVTDLILLNRLFGARTALLKRSAKTPRLNYRNVGEVNGPGIFLSAKGEEFVIRMNTLQGEFEETLTLPYKIPLDSERGKRSVAEVALWSALRALSARLSQD